MFSSSSGLSLDAIQSCNWDGAIPIQLTIATTSISSPTMPAPMYSLVSRNSYLHIALKQSIMRLYQFAPITLSFQSGIQQIEPRTMTVATSSDGNGEVDDSDNDQTARIVAQHQSGESESGDSLPICWFEDVETRMALRWQLFTGVLFDLVRSSNNNYNNKCTKSKQLLQPSTLPWKIRIHFNNYPSQQIIPFQPLSVERQIRQYYQNSIKQSLTLQTGTSKVALNLTKESHGILWDSIQTNNYQFFRQVDCCDFLRKKSENVTRIPIRILVDGKPPLQPSCRCDPDVNDGHLITLGDILVECLPNLFQYQNISVQNSNSHDIDDLKGLYNEEKKKDVLNGIDRGRTCVPIYDEVCWRICGIQPSLEVGIFDLWKYLCHPDHFIYIVVLSR
jgi:Autophagy protein Apg5